MSSDRHLLDFLALALPTIKPRKDGFMDIVEVQYHENTISKIYAYFLNKKKHPAIAELFLISLLQIVKRRTGKAMEFDEHFCSIERQTDKGNRIDLVIESEAKQMEGNDYALIIENKIFSSLHNDLLDYWESIKVPTARKVGILLTLRHHPIPASVSAFFINVTHAEWMNEIRAMGLPYDLDTHLYVYVNDFIRNMETIVTTTDNLSEDARFFFKNTTKILRARKTYDAAWTHVVNQINVFSEKMELRVYGSSNGWRHVWDYQSHVYYVIGFDKTLQESPSIMVMIEVYRDGIARKEELRELLKQAGYYNHLQDDHVSNQSWAHLAYLEYKLSESEIEHLGATLYDKVMRDFEGAYQVVKKALENRATEKA